MEKTIKQIGDIVSIDGFEFDGFIEFGFYCHNCGCVEVYYERYDSSICPECNEWKHDKCGDPDCQFCSDRPEKPLEESKVHFE